MHVRAYARRVCYSLLFLLMLSCTRCECCRRRRRCHVITMSPVGLSPTSLSLQVRSRFVIDTTSCDVFLELPHHCTIADSASTLYKLQLDYILIYSSSFSSHLQCVDLLKHQTVLRSTYITWLLAFEKRGIRMPRYKEGVWAPQSYQILHRTCFYTKYSGILGTLCLDSSGCEVESTSDSALHSELAGSYYSAPIGSSKMLSPPAYNHHARAHHPP